jgi:DNA-binding NtrC family response regulator
LAFANLGIFVDVYTNNQDARSALLWNLGGYDAVISDTGRQSGTEDGMDLLEAIRREHPSIPFIFYTWNASELVRERAGALSVTAVVESPDQLASAVLNALQEASTSARRGRR